MELGWIGVGKMGLPMATHLMRAGHSVTACDAVRAAVAVLEARGGRRAETPAEAARNAAVVFSSVPHDAALRAIALEPQGVLAGIPAGSVFCDTSTVSALASAEIAAAALARGVLYLRATVSGNNHMAEKAALTIMASGPHAAFERVRPLLECFGPSVFYVGAAEQARTLKLVINLLIAGTASLLAEGLALGRRGGLDWAQMLEIVAARAVGSPIVKAKSVELKARDFSPTFTCVQMAKDLDLILGAGKTSGVPMPVTALVAQLNQACVSSGDGELDYIAVVRLIERLAGLAPTQERS